MTETGTVLSVQAEPLGEQLIADAALGATMLFVDDVFDYNPDGGTVSVNGVLYPFTAIDTDANTITLGSALTAAATTDTPVIVWDPSINQATSETTANVELPGVVDGNDDAVIAYVDHALIPLLPEGIRDTGVGEQVTLELRSGVWWVSNVNGQAPLIQGDYLKDGTVPESSLSFLVGGTEITYGSTEPATPNIGDFWYDTTDPAAVVMKRWDGTAWVVVSFDAGSLLQAETIFGNLIAANAVTADKLAAVLLLASTIIAGAASGTRVQIDSSGIAAYDADDNPTVVIGSDGNATFTGSTVSANEIDAETLVINSPTDGGMFIYGSSATPLNANPTFASGTGGWVATATTITYSSIHTFNGHNTMRCQRADGAATVETSPGVVVIPGTQYQVAAVMLSSDGTPIYSQIRWFNASGGLISVSTSPPKTSTSFTSGLLVAAGIAPVGASTAVIRLGFTVSSPSAAFYVASAGITASNTFSSLTNDAGTDAFGNTYPAGLRTAAANIGTLTAGNMNWAGSNLKTNSSGQVVVSHGLGHDPNTIQLTPTAANTYRPFVADHGATTITVGFKNAAGDVVVVGGQTVPFYWFAAV